MKVLQIVENLRFGGLENLVVDFSVCLKNRGYSVDILCLKDCGELGLKAQKAGINVIVLNKGEGFSIKTVLRLVFLLYRRRYDFVHTHNPASMIYGNLAAWFSNTPAINTRHGATLYNKLPLFFWNINSKIITISQDARRALLQVNRISEHKVDVILNGIIFESFTCIPFLSKRPEGVLCVGIVARLAIEKNIETLIRAFALVVKCKPNSVLRIVGDGAQRTMLEKLAQDLGVAAQIEFLGFRDDIPAIVNGFDVFVLSSLTEGISLTLLEAMAASKPVVATQVGGNPEVVLDGKTGFLVPPKDPQAMADKMLTLLNDPALAQKMGAVGRKRVEGVFGLKRMTDEYENVYRSVLK